MRDARRIIKNACVVTMDPSIGDLSSGDILIEGATIQGIAPNIDATDCEVVDGEGMIAIPGFVDAHRHTWQTQLRDMAADWTLFDYMALMRFVYSTCYRPDDVYLGNYAGALEALDAGVTTLVDHSHIMTSPEHADEAIRGLKESGIRAVFCYGMFGTPVHRAGQVPTLEGVAPSPEWHFEDARRVRALHFASRDQLVTMGIAMNELEFFPIEHAKREIELTRELQAVLITSHVGMGALSRGRNFVQSLGNANLLGPDILFSHGSSLSDDELKMIAESGASICATPENELQMGLGYPVTGRATTIGAGLSLGIDIASNHSGDMFSQMRLALQSERALRNHELEARGFAPRQVQFKTRDILEIATLGGAKAAGLESKVGSLTPGKDADIVLIRAESLNMVPMNDPVGAVVLGANAANVDTVFVAGRPIKQAGAMVGLDLHGIFERLRASRDHIIERARKVTSEVKLSDVRSVVARFFPLEE